MTPLQPQEVIPVNPSDNLAERVRNLGPRVSQYAEKLDSADLVANVFSNPNQNSTYPQLDVIVQLPGPSKWQDVNRHLTFH